MEPYMKKIIKSIAALFTRVFLFAALRTLVDWLILNMF